MADSRFAVLDQSEIQSLISNGKAKNENTIKSTRTWLNVWRSWAEERNVNPNIEENPPEVLDEILQRFYAEVRNKQGDHYEPESLRVMIASLERHLRDQKYPFSIIKDRRFQQSKQVLEGRAKLLREEGRGRRPNASNVLSTLEEEELWEKRKLGSGTPRILCQTMWWILTQYFGLKGREVHYSMSVEDFRLCSDDRGIECVICNANPTKTRQSGFSTKRRRPVGPQIFATGGSRCFVELFKEFLSRRPPLLRETGPFYLAIIEKPNSDVWYRTQRLGIHSIDKIMKSLVENNHVAVCGKRLTNLSVRESVPSGTETNDGCEGDYNHPGKQKGNVKAEAPSPQKLQIRVVGPAMTKQQNTQPQKKYIVHQPNGQKVILTPVTSQPAQNLQTQVVRNTITPVGTTVNQIVKTIAAPSNAQNTQQQPGLCIVKVVTHGASVPVNTKPILATASTVTQGTQIKVNPSPIPKVVGPTVTNIGGSHVPKVGGPPVLLKVDSQAAAKYVANLPTMVPVAAVVVDPAPKVVSVQSLAAPEQNYSIANPVQQLTPTEVKPQAQQTSSEYKPLASLMEVNKHAAESSISPVSAVIPDDNTSSTTSPTLGRKDVTVNDRYRYIAPSGKTPIITTDDPGPQGDTPPQVKLETPIQDASAISVKTEPRQSTTSPVSTLKRSHNDATEADEPPRKLKSDSNIIVIDDAPSPPKDTDTNTNIKPLAVSKTEANTSTVNEDTNYMDDSSPQEHKVQPNMDKSIPNIDKSIVDAVKGMSPQQQFKALLSRTQQLYELRGNVCKLLRVLVPELEVDDRQENFQDQTVDELLQQVLEQAETSESEANT